MLATTANYAAAIEGSTTPVQVIDAWYAGELVAPNIPVASALVTYDSTRAIAGSLSLVVQTDDEALNPTAWDSPLAPFGSELHVRAGLQLSGSPELLSCGWFRINECDPQEWWAPYQLPDGEQRWALRGLQLTINAADRMCAVDDNQMLAPEQPASLTSVLNEIARLARDDVPIGEFGVADAAIPSSIAYQQSRVANLQALADLLGRSARVDRNGALRLVTKSPGASVWTVTVGDTAVSWSNRLTRDGVYNGAVALGDGSAPVVGSAKEDVGPLRWDGPFGRVPTQHSSPLITNQTAATAAAKDKLRRSIQERMVPVTVQCPANPAIELDDVMTIVQPNRTLSGQVSSIALPLPLSTMTVVLMVPRPQLGGG